MNTSSPRRPCEVRQIPINGVSTQVRVWPGEAGTPEQTLFCLHGWMDVSASFQFLVDCLPANWQVVAPDWRGFGGSARQGRPYWFPDYLADLDALLDEFSPGQPASLVGHSMGGNIACLYAGIRPERVARLATLEGFGMAAVAPDEAPARYRRWLAGLRETPAFRHYEDGAELAARLQRANPHLPAERAAYLAAHLGEPLPQGGIGIAGDPWHKLVNPVLYRQDEAFACWRRISAPVLWVAARESFIMQAFQGGAGQADYARRKACFASLEEVVLDGAGHLFHLECPARLAPWLIRFFSPPQAD